MDCAGLVTLFQRRSIICEKFFERICTDTSHKLHHLVLQDIAGYQDTTQVIFYVTITVWTFQNIGPVDSQIVLL